MTTDNIRAKFAVAVGAAIAGAAAPALLFLGAGTAQAIQDSEERPAIIMVITPVDPGSPVDVGNPNDLPPIRAFNPQPDPPGFPDPGSSVGTS